MKCLSLLILHAIAVCSLLTSACDPIEPGEETSAAATAGGAETGSTGEGAAQNNQEGDNGLTTPAGGEVTIPELTVPAEASARDKEMVARFSFATVCNSLFNAGTGPSTIVTTDDNGGTISKDIEEETPEGEEGKIPVNCLEGPEISSQDAWDQLSGFLTTDMADCFANDNFWDHRKEGSCVEVQELNLNCNMYEMMDQLDHVKGIRPTLEGYHNMGWRVEQCGHTDDRYWLTLSTVIVAEGKHRYIGKIAEIQNLSEACQGRSGGACLEAENQPDAKVLLVSSPFQIRENSPPTASE